MTDENGTVRALVRQRNAAERLFVECGADLDKARAELARLRPVLEAVRAWDAAWVMGVAGAVEGTDLHNALVTYGPVA